MRDSPARRDDDAGSTPPCRCEVMKGLARRLCVGALVLSGCGGSSGSRTMEDGGSMMPATPLTLHSTGVERQDGEDFRFYRWGLWGGVVDENRATCAALGCPPPGDAIFWAYLLSEGGGIVLLEVDGVRSGTSPAGGSATWTGGVRACEILQAVPSPITGKSRLEVDFVAGTVDVAFTSFDVRRADMSWSGLTSDHGAFGGEAMGMDGSFYGANHEGAASTFGRDGLAGVFGALRTLE